MALSTNGRLAAGTTALRLMPWPLAGKVELPAAFEAVVALDVDEQAAGQVARG